MNVAQAKQLHLKALMARLGHEADREVRGECWYLSPFRKESEASFKITQDGKGWYDHGAGQGGNILDFVIRYFNLPENGIREALLRLEEILGMGGRQLRLYVPATREEEGAADPAGNAVDQPAAVTMEKIGPVRRRALIQYLAGRGIALPLVRPYLRQMDYRHRERQYFALAFASDAGGYELRSAHFKGCYGPKSLTTLPVPKASAVSVFEGFMDFLSAVAYMGRPPRQHSVVLNSASMRERALDTIRRLEVERVHLYLDQDGAGRELTSYFADKLSGLQVMDESWLYAGHKDLNDYWMARKTVTLA